jgi:hypothetical protein
MIIEILGEQWDFDGTQPKPVKGSGAGCYREKLWRPAGSGERGSGRTVEAGLRCRGEGAGYSGNEWAASGKRRHANGAGQQDGEARMYMRMVMVARRSALGGAIGVGWRGVVRMFVSVLVAVVTEMRRMTLRIFQHVAHATTAA